MEITLSAPLTVDELRDVLATKCAPSARLVGICGGERFQITSLCGPNDHGEMFVTLAGEETEPAGS